LNDCAWDNGTGRLRPFIGLSGDVMIDRNGRRDSYERVNDFPTPFRPDDHRLVIQGEACPSVVGTTKFNPDTYLGNWFQMAALPFYWSPEEDTCVTAQYYPAPAGSNYDVQVVNSERQPTGNRQTSVGKAVINPNQPGTLGVAFGPITPTDDMDNYIILDTDNVNYSYVWSCASYCLLRQCSSSPILWILNRNHNAPANNVQTQIDEALSILVGFGFSEDAASQVRQNMLITNQSSETCDAYYQENQDLTPQ